LCWFGCPRRFDGVLGKRFGVRESLLCESDSAMS
jgi:hypothetical protein